MKEPHLMGKVKWTIDLLTLHLNILIKRMIMLPKTHIQWGNMKHFIFLKGYTVGKPKIWGLKLCRALFSLGGLIHRPKKYFDQLIDEKRTTPTQNPISDRRVTNPKENSDSHSTRALPPKPEPFTSSKPAPSPRPSKTELPVSGNQYENVKFPETMDVSSPDKPATPGLSSRGK